MFSGIECCFVLECDVLFWDFCDVEFDLGGFCFVEVGIDCNLGLGCDLDVECGEEGFGLWNWK